MKGESAVDVDRGETELLAADVLRDESVAIDGHLPEVPVVAEVAKGDTARHIRVRTSTNGRRVERISATATKMVR